MRFQLFRRSGHWRWRLVSRNGRVTAESGAYQNRADCLAGIEMVKRLDPSTPVEDATDDASVRVTCLVER